MVRLLLLLAFLMPACAGLPVLSKGSVAPLPGKINGNLQVAGKVLIRGTVRVSPGAELTLAPGTVVLFEPRDEDGDGISDTRLVVEGTITARGTPPLPVIFTSASTDPSPGDWLEIRVDRSSGNVFEHCIVEFSRYGLHSHFSSGVVADSIFRRNIDGTRFGRSRFVVRNNRFEDNIGKGINLRQSPVYLYENLISGNRHGLFLFEGGSGTVLDGNVFTGNSASDVRLGDFFTGELPRFGRNAKNDGSALLFDGPEAILKELPDLSETMQFSGHAGPRVLDVSLVKFWETSAGGFIDAAPFSMPGGRIGAATWNGEILQISGQNGSVLRRTVIGDVVDATPVVFDEWVFFPAWDLRVRRVDLDSGKVDGEQDWPRSPADDHRQGDPVLARSGFDGASILFGLWDGEAAALDPVKMVWKWRTQLDGPTRTGVVFDGANFWLGTDEGTVYALNQRGDIFREVSLGSRVRAKPSVLGKDDLVFSIWDGRVIRLRAGQVLWEKKLLGKGTYAGPVSGISPVGAIAAADGSGNLYLFDNDGVLLWRVGLGSAVHTLSLADNILWAGTQKGDLYAVKSSTGRVLGNLHTGGAIHGRPLHESGTMIFGSRDGFLRAFTETVTEAPWEWK